MLQLISQEAKLNSCRHEDLNSRSNYDLFSELSVTSPGLYQRLELTSTFFFYHLTHNKGQIMTHESARKYSLSLFCLTTKRIIESQRSNLVEHLGKKKTQQKVLFRTLLRSILEVPMSLLQSSVKSDTMLWSVSPKRH